MFNTILCELQQFASIFLRKCRLHLRICIHQYLESCVNSFLLNVYGKTYMGGLCSLVVRVSGYRSRVLGFDSRPYGVHSPSWGQLWSYLNEKVAARV
jgi:hypothetical protein